MFLPTVIAPVESGGSVEPDDVFGDVVAVPDDESPGPPVQVDRARDEFMPHIMPDLRRSDVDFVPQPVLLAVIFTVTFILRKGNA